jgi:hypothetical protein
MPNVGVDRHVSNDLSDIAAYVRAFTASLKKRAQRCQIVGIGATHRPSDEWPHHGGESGRLPAIAKNHASRSWSFRVPLIGRLHGERSVGRSHHETPIRIELRDFVRVRKLAAKEVSDERNA